MNSEVLIYTSVFRAEYVTLNVEVFHLSSSGIWINLNLSQQEMEGQDLSDLY